MSAQSPHPSVVGIGDLAVYIPRPVIELDRLVAERGAADPALHRKLQRALVRTGQRAIRFPQPWEDPATMAAQAAQRLLSRMSASQVAALRYIAVGTETTVDLAKPIAAHVQGMLQRAGYAVPDTLSTFQLQHACAGGTISLLGVGAQLAMSRHRQQCGLIICTDIARYRAGSSAEITQGAGAVAMLAEQRPRLLELELTDVGYSSRDVDDFFRPLGSETAQVKGSYSIRCYEQAVEEALLDYCAQIGAKPADALAATDLFALHAPYSTLPDQTLSGLVGKYLSRDRAQARAFLTERQFEASLAPTAVVGNLYSGSLYLATASLLWQRYRVLGDAIIGKRMTLISYGSGNTAVVLGGRVSAQAPRVIASWQLDDVLDHAEPASFADYDRWAQGNTEVAQVAAEQVPAGAFYLERIREDGYRMYQHRPGHAE